MSVASFHSLPIFCQTTTYFPLTCCDCWSLVISEKVPTSRAASLPSGFTSTVVSFKPPTASPALDHLVAGREQIGVLRVHVPDGGKVALVEGRRKPIVELLDGGFVLSCSWC